MHNIEEPHEWHTCHNYYFDPGFRIAYSDGIVQYIMQIITPATSYAFKHLSCKEVPN